MLCARVVVVHSNHGACARGVVDGVHKAHVVQRHAVLLVLVLGLGVHAPHVQPQHLLHHPLRLFRAAHNPHTVHTLVAPPRAPLPLLFSLPPSFLFLSSCLFIFFLPFIIMTIITYIRLHP